MFGMGFMEIIIVLVIAILFLGPDKLPTAMVEMAKFIKGIKKGVGDAKTALDDEIRISDLKDEALSYKKTLENAASGLNGFKNIGLDDMLEAETKSEKKKIASQVEQKKENISFEKKPAIDTSKKEEIKDV
jgi:sec-independent protein translocase protein TatB